uniref:Uncharacterized protein n=1 Tax=Zea mays TaxID=4577 RepID=A0A804MIT8_MAIZE
MHPPQPPAATGSLAAQWIWWKKGWSEAQGRDGESDGDGSGGRKDSVEEAEQFLCSMLGDNSELDMGVVRDVPASS